MLEFVKMTIENSLLMLHSMIHNGSKVTFSDTRSTVINVMDQTEISK